MNAILATGGLNDVAMGIAELFDIGFFLVISLLLALSWWKRSLVATVVASLLVLMQGALLEPWTVIAPPNDFYEAYWVYRLRVECMVWGLLFVGAVACVIRIIRHRRRCRVNATPKH